MFLRNPRKQAFGTDFSNGSVDGPAREQEREAFVITMVGMGVPPGRATHPTALRPTTQGPKNGGTGLFTLDRGSGCSRKLETAEARYHIWYTWRVGLLSVHFRKLS